MPREGGPPRLNAFLFALWDGPSHLKFCNGELSTTVSRSSRRPGGIEPAPIKCSLASRAVVALGGASRAVGVQRPRP